MVAPALALVQAPALAQAAPAVVQGPALVPALVPAELWAVVWVPLTLVEGLAAPGQVSALVALALAQGLLLRPASRRVQQARL